VGALHGDMDQPSRFATLNRFKTGELRLLVCSDVAARGLDIGGLSHVFNFDVPFHAEDYVHRIGRTGRAGREGRAYTIATPDDARSVAAIEVLTGFPIPRIEVEGLDPVSAEELVEAASRPRRGRGGGRATAGGGRARSGGASRGTRSPGPERDGTAAPASRGRAARGGAASAAGGEPRPRPERAARRPERAAAARGGDAVAEAPPVAAVPIERGPRRDRRTDDAAASPRRRGDRDDLGPAVQGFGDAVPAFMLIPIPRPRRDAAPDPADTEQAAA